MTNSSQTTTDTFRYDVWGDTAERTGATPTPHQFVGALGYEREADSGLYFIGTRYYDPSTGRFLSQDAAQAGVNWYVYAANNPVSGFDYGGQWWETALDIAGLILDIKDAIEDPSWDDILWIGGDIISLIAPTPTPSIIRHGGKLLGHADDVIRHGDEAVDVVRHLDDPPLYHYTDPSGAAHIGNIGQIEPHPQSGLPYVFAAYTSPSNMDTALLGHTTGKPGSTITHAFEIHNPQGWSDFYPITPPGVPLQQWAFHDPPVPVKPVGQLRWEFMTDGNPLIVVPGIQK